MSTLSPQVNHLREVAAAIVSRPEFPADLAEELRLIYSTLRNHAYYVDFLKRELDELRAELDQL